MNQPLASRDRRPPPSPLWRYGVVLLTVGLALLITLGIEPVAALTPFSFFYAAVVVSTWYGGRRPGLLAVVLSALVGDYFLVPPLRSLALDRDALLQVGTFVLVALLINWLTAARRRGEQSLREAAEAAERDRAQMEAIFQAVGEGIVVSDAAGNLFLVNEAEARINGYSSPEEMRQNISYFAEVYELQHLDGRPLPVADWPLSRVLRGESFADWELRGRRKDTGQEWLFSFSGEPVRAERAEQSLAVLVTRDITEQRQLEEQFRQSQKMEAVGRLAGGIAHDFNNLLTAINGYSDLAIRQLKDDAPLRRKLEEIRKAGERAAGLTRQLLAFSRKQVLQPVVLDLTETVAGMDRMLRRLIGEDVELATMLDPALRKVRADPGQVEQVLLNLCVNARDAMPRGGRLTVETKNVRLDEAYARRHASVTPGYYVMLAVSDTGVGMDAATQERIFEPFFTTKAPGQGTGLGLSTVYGIVKQSGGNIWVYSEPGHGTTFKVYLPAAVGEGEAVLHASVAPERAPGTETVLLVEDEEMVRRLLLDILESEGYTVLAASGGQEAIEACARHDGPLHLVLTDVVMPGMSGRELIEDLGERCAGAKVIYMSGYTDNAIVHHGVLDPGVAFLQKPFTPDAVLRKVREALDGG